MNKISMMKKIVAAFFCSIIMQGAQATPPTGSVPDGTISETLFNPKTWLSFAQSVGRALKWPMCKGAQELPGFMTNAFTLCQESPLLSSTFAAIYLWNNADNVVDTCNFMVDNRWTIATALGSVVMQDLCAFSYIAAVLPTMSLAGCAIADRAWVWNCLSNANTTSEKIFRTFALSTVLGVSWSAC